MTDLPTFGQLRSTLHASLEARRDRDALLVLLLQRHAHDPQAYRDQWLPYLESFADGLPDPFATVTSLEQAEEAAALLPGARFRLSLSGQTTEHVRALLGDPRLRLISSLCLYKLGLTDELLSFLLRDKSLTRLLELDLGANRELTLAPILESHKLGDLQVLDLHATYIWNPEQLCQAHDLSSLRVLDLGGMYLRQDHAHALRAHFPHLTNLYLD